MGILHDVGGGVNCEWGKDLNYLDSSLVKFIGFVASLISIIGVVLHLFTRDKKSKIIEILRYTIAILTSGVTFFYSSAFFLAFFAELTDPIFSNLPNTGLWFLLGLLVALIIFTLGFTCGFVIAFLALWLVTYLFGLDIYDFWD
ncbi:hypothetical protein HYR99_08045 [Candidatus Poribacteria bacterium]|nr:hypothetical protein [Candidatus Poribacteria bacterium]